MDLLDRLRLRVPVVQAGMGGGIARSELAAAVSGAGGLGTIGILPPGELEREIVAARERAPGAPLAVNLLVPFLRRAHVEICLRQRADAVVLFFGWAPREVAALRRAGIFVLYQVGTGEQARRAVLEGVDGLIAQGLEAGGHLRGVRPLTETLPEVLDAAPEVPVLAAGGIVDRDSARRALDAGAAAVVAGTRFLLTEECHAHPAYQRRVLGARHTLDTRLFGLGWPERHRVVPNAATDRWCRGGGGAAPVADALARHTARLGALLPLRAVGPMTAAQHPRLPLFGPGPPVRGMPDRVVESAALYAGVAAREVHAIVPAAEAVRELAGEAPA